MNGIFLQPAVSLVMLYGGLVLGILYAVLRIFRTVFRSRACTAICDLLFVGMGACVSAICILLTTKGVLRAFACLFLIAGFFLARFACCAVLDGCFRKRHKC